MVTKSGTAGSDTLIGSTGADTLNGLGGNDTLIGRSGPDVLDGGAGNDTADYSASASGVQVGLVVAHVGSGGDAEGDRCFNIERIIGSTHNDILRSTDRSGTLLGNTGNDSLQGSGFNDLLFGGTGNDTVFGGGGSDSISGGDGIDTAVYADATEGVIVNLLFGTAAGSTATGDTLAAIENINGSGFGDFILGDTGGNLLKGLAGNDTLFGLGGNDVLAGGIGGDTLKGDNGIDTADYSSSATSVTVMLGGGFAGFGDAQGDRLESVENLTGSGGNDELGGDAGTNLVKDWLDPTCCTAPTATTP
jgi:Ca2+-binding RTX toxin-like protein